MSKFSNRLFLFLIVLTLAGCNALSDQTILRGSGRLASEQRDVEPFTAIRTTSDVDVVLTQGDRQEVVASADDNVLPYLRTEVRQGTLVIDLRDDSRGGLSLLNLRHQPTVEIMAPDVDTLVTTSSGDIEADRLEGQQLTLESTSSGNIDVDTLVGTRVSIHASSSGNIEVADLDVEDVSATLTSSGNVTLAGQTVSQEVEVTSSGNYKAGSLASDEARVTLDSSGDATVWVGERLDGSSSSSGQIRYYGNPRINGNGKLVALGGR